MNSSLEFSLQLDERDVLRSFRDRFIIPTEKGVEKIYFLGNSLGLQPKSTAAYLQSVMNQWAEYGVEAFFEGSEPWLRLHESLAIPLSKIVGAKPSEVVVMNQLSVNLHLMMVSFYKPEGKRKKILCEAKAFPSDQYMIETHIRHYGFDPNEITIEVTPRAGEYLIRKEDILSAIELHKDELALVIFGGVNYYTGQLFDIASITEAAHNVGAKVGFDLAHAVGNVPLELHAWDVDFACWCSYKYLNSGPGAIAGAYIHERYHSDHSLKRFGGWWGYEKDSRFLMKKEFKPAQSAEGWQLSTPPILLYAAHRAALEIFEDAGIANLIKKGTQLSDYLLFLLNDINERNNNKVQVLTPNNSNEKGCQVSMLIQENGREVFNHLTASNIFVDWREPDVIRVAPVPLYNRFSEVWKFAQVLEEALIQ
jgi:kynureninase